MGTRDTESGTGPMVSVRNAFKSYGKNQVLRDFNLTVSRGSIYAFLGPSGCGKTTLLSCLVGLRELDSGQISLGISYKHQLGYMPQATALIRDLTIQEIIYFFGKLLGISADKLKMRKKELYTLLDLPPESTIVSTLSGGQQRRVSLCIALLHDPQLLILDEPTVGLDPVLSHKIWMHLVELAGSGQKTIVITTHYIEEAGNADMVGMMRRGVLVAEGRPGTMMAEHGTDRLEEVFLRFSQQQERKPQEEIPTTPSSGHNRKPHIVGDKLFSMNRLCALILKNIFWLIRNTRYVFILVVVLVSIQTFLFSWCIGRDPRSLNLGVVNDELASGRAANYTGDSSFNCASPSLASLRYLQHLGKKKINLINFLDEESAEKATRRGDIRGYLHISGNYTGSLFKRMELGVAAPDEVPIGSDLSVVIEASNYILKNIIKRDVSLAYKDYLEELYGYCNWPVKAAWIPIKELAVYGHVVASFTDYTIPSALTTMAFCFPPFYSQASILMEKRDGLTERSFISGLTMLEYLIGYGIVGSILLLFETYIMIFVFFEILGHVCIGSLNLTFLITFLTGCSGNAYGLLVAVICDSELTATSLGVGVLFLYSIVCGLFWPIQCVHKLIRPLSSLLPFGWTSEALRSVTARGVGFTHPTVYQGVAISLAFTAFLIATIYLYIKLKNFFRRLLS